MQSDFLAKVHTMYNQFTKAEKKVADFILQNPKKVLFMSITELADECQVGDTSVFRFCRTMGAIRNLRCSFLSAFMMERKRKVVWPEKPV